MLVKKHISGPRPSGPDLGRPEPPDRRGSPFGVPIYAK